MTALRRTSLALAGAATVLWGLMLLAVVTADPADGANIGAGMAGLLAMTLSTAASTTLLVVVAGGRSRAGTEAPAGDRRGVPWTAAGLAVVSLVAWPVVWFGAYALPDPVLTAVLVGGVVAMVGSSLLLLRAGARTRRTADRGRGRTM